MSADYDSVGGSAGGTGAPKNAGAPTSEAKTDIYPVPVTIRCPSCGAEFTAVFHQRTVDEGDICQCDVPDIYDPICCTRCGFKILLKR